MSMWARAATPKSSSTNQVPESTNQRSHEIKSKADDTASATTVDDNSDAQTPPTDAARVVEMKSKRCTPAQDAAKAELDSVNAQLASLLQLKNIGLWTTDMKIKVR